MAFVAVFAVFFVIFVAFWLRRITKVVDRQADRIIDLEQRLKDAQPPENLSDMELERRADEALRRAGLDK